MDPPTRIRRTIRACLQCRTRKQRCDGPYTVPCQRCKSAGRECSFETEAVPESPRFHPYSGDRNFSPHAMMELQREYVQIPQLSTFPPDDRAPVSQAYRHQAATRNHRNQVGHRTGKGPKIRGRRAHLRNAVRRRKVSSLLTLCQSPTLLNHLGSLHHPVLDLGGMKTPLLPPFKKHLVANPLHARLSIRLLWPHLWQPCVISPPTQKAQQPAINLRWIIPAPRNRAQSYPPLLYLLSTPSNEA